MSKKTINAVVSIIIVIGLIISFAIFWTAQNSKIDTVDDPKKKSSFERRRKLTGFAPPITQSVTVDTGQEEEEQEEEQEEEETGQEEEQEQPIDQQEEQIEQEEQQEVTQNETSTTRQPDPETETQNTETTPREDRQPPTTTNQPTTETSTQNVSDEPISTKTIPVTQTTDEVKQDDGLESSEVTQELSPQLDEQETQGLPAILRVPEVFFDNIEESIIPDVIEQEIQEEVPKLAQLWENKPLQSYIQFGIVPYIGAVSAVNLVNTVSVGGVLIPYVQYLFQLFTEPFKLLAGKRERKNGIVFDGFTSQPLDLAIIRLHDAQTNKLVKTYVSDPKGRYYFILNPDIEYYITVQRSGYNFPSEIKNFDNFENIYLGKIFSFTRRKTKGITSNGVVTFNIPLTQKKNITFTDRKKRDPISTAIADIEVMNASLDTSIHKENEKILKKNRAKIIANIIAHIGPILGIAVFVLAPSLLTAGFVVLHIALFLLFKKLVEIFSVDSWGSVLSTDKKPLQAAVVRLFETKFGRQVMAITTSIDGKYGFIVDDKPYIVVPRKKGYIFPENAINVQPKEGYVREDIILRKNRDV